MLLPFPLHYTATPQGHIPVLEIDGKQLPQSNAIESYVAKEFGMESLIMCYFLNDVSLCVSEKWLFNGCVRLAFLGLSRGAHSGEPLTRAKRTTTTALMHLVLSCTKWPTPQAGQHWGLTQVSPWSDVKAIRTHRGRHRDSRTHPVFVASLITNISFFFSPGLYGSDNWEAAQIDVVRETLKDLIEPMIMPVLFELDKDKQVSLVYDLNVHLLCVTFRS